MRRMGVHHPPPPAAGPTRRQGRPAGAVAAGRDAAHRVLVWAPLPSTLGRYKPMGKQYNRAASRYQQLGARYSTCGAGLNLADKTLFKDGLHPVAAGYDVLFSCLQPRVAAMVREQQAKEAAAAAPPPRRPLPSPKQRPTPPGKA